MVLPKEKRPHRVKRVGVEAQEVYRGSGVVAMEELRAEEAVADCARSRWESDTWERHRSVARLAGYYMAARTVVRTGVVTARRPEA